MIYLDENESVHWEEKEGKVRLYAQKVKNIP